MCTQKNPISTRWDQEKVCHFWNKIFNWGKKNLWSLRELSLWGITEYALLIWVVSMYDDGFPNNKVHGANMGPIWSQFQRLNISTLTRTIRTPAFWGYPRRLMITHTIESCWIPSQNKVEWPWRYRSRSKVITCDTPSHVSNHLYQIWKESIQNCRRYRADTIFKVKVERPWRYRSRSKVITCDTPPYASDHLYQIWKESIRNCRCYRADTVFKAKAKWPWRYRSRSKVIYATHPLILVIICDKYGKNPSRNVDFYFQGQGRKISKNLPKFQISRFRKKRNTRHTH